MQHRIHFVEASRCKLLERVDVHLNLLYGECEALCQRGVLVFKRLNGCINDEFLYLVLENLNLGLIRVNRVKCDLSFHLGELFVEKLDHLSSLGFLVLRGESEIILQLLYFLLKPLQLLIRRHTRVSACAAQGLDDLLLLLNDLPKEPLSEVFVVLFVDLWVIRQHAIFDPADDCVLQQQGLAGVSQETFGFLELVQVVDIVALHVFDVVVVVGSLHIVVRLVFDLNDERLAVLPIFNIQV